MRSNGKCHNAAGQTVDNLGSQYQAINASQVAAVAKLHGVAAAAGGRTLPDNQLTLPKNFGQPGGSLPQPKGFNVDGVDIGHSSLGPLSAGTIKSGHSLTAAEANSDVAVVDSGYAKANSLKVGSTVTIAKTKFTVVGIVAQPQGGSPPRSEEHTSELQSHLNLLCRLLLEKKKKQTTLATHFKRASHLLIRKTIASYPAPLTTRAADIH